MAFNFFLENASYASSGAYCAKVSDLAIGGTVMALWAALRNMGQM
jgi:hypothetical protein